MRLVPSALAAALALALVGLPAAPASAGSTQGQQGLQGGWPVDDSGRINFTHSIALQFGFIQQAGAGWVRINFRLGACYPDWTSIATICPSQDAPTALQLYDRVVDAAHGSNLKVLGLISNESWRGGQEDWIADNAERRGGTGDNAYIRSFAHNVAGPLARHFAGRVDAWEIWNEPNAWTSNTSPGVYSGGSFMYPSNFAWLLARSYAAIKAEQPGGSSVVISGGLFGHDGDGAPPTVGVKGASVVSGQHLTCASSVASGADYLCNTYAEGIDHAGWRSGSFPLDRIGQHLYIDQGTTTTPQRLMAYLNDVRVAYADFEGSGTTKLTEVTEVGWSANPNDPTYADDEARQMANLQIAFSTFAQAGFVSRAYWFNIQDVPEAGLYYSLVDGGSRYSLGTPKLPVFSAYQEYARP